MPENNQVNSKDFADDVKAIARETALRLERGSALALYRAIENALKQPDLSEDVRPLYEEALRDALFAALPLLPEREVLQGLEKHLLYFVGQEYDLLSALKSRLAGIPVIEDRDVLRAKLREALMQAQGKISEEISLPQGTQAGAPGNWIRYYLQGAGSALPDPLKRAEFFSSRPVTQLDSLEQIHLKRLLEIFDYLRLSSATGAGFEEELVADFDDRIMILQDGQVIQVDPKTDPLMSQQMPAIMNVLKQAWMQQAATPTDLEKEAREQAKGLNPAAAQQTIAGVFAAKGSKDQKGGLAALYGAIRGGLDPFLKQILPTLQDYIKAGSEAERVLPLLQTGLVTPALAKLFFQTYLIKLLGFSPDHAAALVGRLLGALPPVERDKYFKVAFYDFEKGWFIWREV